VRGSWSASFHRDSPSSYLQRKVSEQLNVVFGEVGGYQASLQRTRQKHVIEVLQPPSAIKPSAATRGFFVDKI
jgi:hypothetical protein